MKLGGRSGIPAAKPSRPTSYGSVPGGMNGGARPSRSTARTTKSAENRSRRSTSVGRTPVNVVKAKKYMKDKAEPIIEKIVQRLAVHQPEDVLGFIAEYVAKEQARIAEEEEEKQQETQLKKLAKERRLAEAENKRRIEQEQAEKEKQLKLEQEKLEQEKREQAKLAKQRAKQEKERLEQERLEQERLEQERLEQKRLEHERLKQERLERERLEQERLENERLEQQRLEQERLENERLEQQRLEEERLEQERLENERLKQQRLEEERLEQERLEAERAEQERLEQARLENERLEQELAENEKPEDEDDEEEGDGEDEHEGGEENDKVVERSDGPVCCVSGTPAELKVKLPGNETVEYYARDIYEAMKRKNKLHGSVAVELNEAFPEVEEEVFEYDEETKARIAAAKTIDEVDSRPVTPPKRGFEMTRPGESYHNDRNHREPINVGPVKFEPRALGSTVTDGNDDDKRGAAQRAAAKRIEEQEAKENLTDEQREELKIRRKKDALIGKIRAHYATMGGVEPLGLAASSIETLQKHLAKCKNRVNAQTSERVEQEAKEDKEEKLQKMFSKGPGGVLATGQGTCIPPATISFEPRALGTTSGEDIPSAPLDAAQRRERAALAAARRFAPTK